jgi:ankyrin repeat protein
MDESKLPKGVPAGAFEEIHLAARNRDAARVAALLEGGVDPNLRNRKEPNGDGGNTPLWFAAQGARPGGVPVAEALLDAGARIDERCEYGTTALHMAVCWAHPDMIEFLMARGADAQARDDDGQTPLEMARAERIRVQERMNRGRLAPGVETRDPVPALPRHSG